jgi:TPR repeat protein
VPEIRPPSAKKNTGSSGDLAQDTGRLSMIKDLIDLESLLGRYDAAKILVGPVLRLSRSSSSRYVFIAGKGTKVYHSIRLGSVVVEWNAQQQRDTIVEKLRGRFAEVSTFDNFIPMAHSAHRFWPNAETIDVLRVLTGEAKLQTANSDSNNDNNATDNVRSAAVVGQSDSFVMSDSFLLGDCAVDGESFPLVPFKLNASSETGERLPNVSESSELGNGSTPQSSTAADALNAALSIDCRPLCEDTGSSIGDSLDAGSSVENATKLPGEDSEIGDAQKRSITDSLAELARLRLEDTGTLASSTESAVRPAAEAPQLSVKGARHWAATALQVAMVGGVAGLLISMVYLGGQRVSDQAMPAWVRAPFVAANDAVQALVARTMAAANRVVQAVEPMPRVEPARANQIAKAADAMRAPASSLSSQPTAARATGLPSLTPQVASPHLTASPDDSASLPTRVASADADAASGAQTGSLPVTGAVAALPLMAPDVAGPDADAVPVSTPARSSLGEVLGAPAATQPAEASPAAVRLTADAITTLVDRATEFLNNGDFASARPLLRRAAEAGNATAALMMGRTFDPLLMHEVGAVGIAPDITQARLWYERAAALGSDTAAQRLAALIQAHQ